MDTMERTKFGKYSGPIQLNTNPTSGQMIVVNCHSTNAIATTAGGVMAGEITFNPNTTNQWASYAARFGEYRLLAVQLHYEPRFVTTDTYASPGVCAGLALAMNKGAAAGTPTTYVSVMGRGKHKLVNTRNPFTYTIRADDYTDNQMYSTASPTSVFSFLYYANGLPASLSPFGDLFITWVLQFSNPN